MKNKLMETITILMLINIVVMVCCTTANLVNGIVMAISMIVFLMSLAQVADEMEKES